MNYDDIAQIAFRLYNAANQAGTKQSILDRREADLQQFALDVNLPDETRAMLREFRDNAAKDLAEAKAEVEALTAQIA